ncbi:disulfide bond formation protein B [Curvibacter sp. CHRR-16]|uniref:disulfide bond formation protein B n=1 Tax=Curvibacter sp. CHRR-16 TaxID=2835872 RepID=UPI001BDA00EF|nr:disulfide bond formation protein B [Curvibacter sp. CHRR-16]MBT0571037.1 disulfide bond formation protein B [Curvibacter sp. CHRR-16]
MNLMTLWNNCFGSPRRVLAAIALFCAALLAFGMYLQHVVGLEPCPMCIVQRYAMVLIALVAGLASSASKKWIYVVGSFVVLVLAVAGAGVAARQSWLQWYPPEFVSCGRDLYGMIENFPLQRALPMIFKGSGDCSKVDWTFLGGSIANWSFICFVLVAVTAATVAFKQLLKAR